MPPWLCPLHWWECQQAEGLAHVLTLSCALVAKGVTGNFLNPERYNEHYSLPATWEYLPTVIEEEGS